MKPILLEIVTKMITTFDHCSRCAIIFDEAGLKRSQREKEEFDRYPQDLKEEFVKLTDWIGELSHLYKHRLLIKLIDAQSLLGVYKSLRHRIRHYPAFIIEGKETLYGWDKSRLEELLDKHIKGFVLSKTRSVQSNAF
jgi:hypothetical protein